MRKELYKYIIYIYEKKNDLMKEILNSDLIYSDNIQIKKILENISNFNININLNDIIEQITYIDNKVVEFRNNINIIKNLDTDLIHSEKELITLLRKKKINSII